MIPEVRLTRDGDVAVITLHRPPANALTRQVRDGIIDILDKVANDTDLVAVVLAADGDVFSAGAEITEIDSGPKAPWLNTLCDRIERMTKPVVAAVSGQAIGGGFEIALAAHARVADISARVGLPEVTLGLVPSGGGTQRLPRLVGAGTALEMLMTGRVVPVTETALDPVFDTRVDTGVQAASRDLARKMAASGDWKRVCDREDGFADGMLYQTQIDAARTQSGGDAASAALRCVIACVEAAQLLPFDQGGAFEQAQFQDILNGPEAKSARHVYAAERRTVPSADLAGAGEPVRHVVIQGVQGPVPELAVSMLDRGARVTLSVPSPVPAKLIQKRVRAIYDGAVERGRLSPKNRDARMHRLGFAVGQDCLSEADLILDTGGTPPETYPALKHGAALAVLSTRPRALNEIAKAGLGHAALLIRLHGRPHLAQVIEYAPGPDIAPDALGSAIAFLKQGGRILIRSGVSDGLIHMVIADALFRVALALRDLGLSVADIDGAAQQVGFAKGPFTWIDGQGAQQVLARLTRDGMTPQGVQVLHRLVADKATGRAGGKGFYIYDGDDTAPNPDLPDPQSDASLPDGVSAAEAVLAAVVDSAARLLAAQTARQASDIDVLVVKAMGFDRAKGGPLLLSDRVGAFRSLRVLKALDEVQPGAWQHSGALDDMVKNGQGFFGRVGQS